MTDRKAAISKFKEQKVVPGIYAVRCVATEDIWVGRTANLAGIWNRTTFELRHGGCRTASLQAAWARHGSEAWSFEIKERLDDEDILPYQRDGILKEKLERWCAQLGALRIV